MVTPSRCESEGGGNWPSGMRVDVCNRVVVASTKSVLMKQLRYKAVAQETRSSP